MKYSSVKFVVAVGLTRDDHQRATCYNGFGNYCTVYSPHLVFANPDVRYRDSGIHQLVL